MARRRRPLILSPLLDTFPPFELLSSLTLDSTDIMEDLRYPNGKFTPPGRLTDDARRDCILAIAETPRKLKAAVAGLTDAQLDTPYREGGWTVRQVVHHIADSHLNAYVRFKLAITEDEPGIKTYQEKLWAETVDAKKMPVGVSLALLENLHDRWVTFLGALTPGDFDRKFHHPENGPRDLHWLLALYAWHGRHHEAHVVNLRKRMGW
jgi:hypothetical protein